MLRTLLLAACLLGLAATAAAAPPDPACHADFATATADTGQAAGACLSVEHVHFELYANAGDCLNCEACDTAGSTAQACNDGNPCTTLNPALAEHKHTSPPSCAPPFVTAWRQRHLSTSTAYLQNGLIIGHLQRSPLLC